MHEIEGTWWCSGWKNRRTITFVFVFVSVFVFAFVFVVLYSHHTTAVDENDGTLVLHWMEKHKVAF